MNAKFGILMAAMSALGSHGFDPYNPQGRAPKGYRRRLPFSNNTNKRIKFSGGRKR